MFDRRTKAQIERIYTNMGGPQQHMSERDQDRLAAIKAANARAEKNAKEKAAREAASEAAARSPGIIERVRESVFGKKPEEEEPLLSPKANKYIVTGGKKAGTKCVSTGKKITFTRNGKMVTRIIHEHSNGSKCVKYNDNWVPLSKLKI